MSTCNLPQMSAINLKRLSLEAINSFGSKIIDIRHHVFLCCALRSDERSDVHFRGKGEPFRSQVTCSRRHVWSYTPTCLFSKRPLGSFFAGAVTAIVTATANTRRHCHFYWTFYYFRLFSTAMKKNIHKR